MFKHPLGSKLASGQFVQSNIQKVFCDQANLIIFSEYECSGGPLQRCNVCPDAYGLIGGEIQSIR